MSRKHSQLKAIACWCGQPNRVTCCGPFLSGIRLPSTAEELMRSRYSAYVSGDSQYLLDTWHPDTKPESLQINPKQKWLGLKIRATQAGSAYDNDGMVEFVARFKIDGSGHRLHERSHFTKVNGKWTYREGQLITKAGRKAS